MFGFFVGTLCVIGFVAVLRRRSWGRYGYWSHHRHGWGHHHGPGRWGGAGLYGLFHRLDTSPGQEKAIRAAVEELRDTMSSFTPELRASRGELANAMRGEVFDARALEGALDGHMVEARSFGSAVLGTLAKVHETLDPDQRRRLARMIESGPHACLV
jgi:Spy/CpxP family protein refolding chaperone